MKNGDLLLKGKDFELAQNYKGDEKEKEELEKIVKEKLTEYYNPRLGRDSFKIVCFIHTKLNYDIYHCIVDLYTIEGKHYNNDCSVSGEMVINIANSLDPSLRKSLS